MSKKPVKYVFVFGGVLSGLGKGIVASSLGYLLKSLGLRVTIQKLDPYLNVDPGTMNPYQHGEVFVLDDGSETDLDLGHYERFIDESLSRDNTTSSGRVYWDVLERERKGDYLGDTIQVIPHITDEIKKRINKVNPRKKYDIVITEVGGTVGDIEGQPFYEAIRQLILEKGKNTTSYKFALLRSLIDYGKTYPNQPLKISYDWLAEQFISYFWDMTIKFRIQQSNNRETPPIVMSFIEEEIQELNQTSQYSFKKYQTDYLLL